jgi:hypothetical protein
LSLNATAMPRQLNPTHYPTPFRRLYLHQDQFQEWLLAQVFGPVHWIIISFRLISDLWIGPARKSHHQKDLDLLVWILSIITWRLWKLLFRYHDVFLWFRRPGKWYQYAVYTTAYLTIIPTLAMHIGIIVLSSKIVPVAGSLVKPISFGSAIVAVCVLVPMQAFFLKMVRRHLLHDVDEHYEPTSHPQVEPLIMLDESPSGILSELYSGQFVSLSTSHDLNQLGDNEWEATETWDLESEAERLSNGVAIEATTAPSPECHEESPCSTVAYFDYMSQSDTGIASYSSFPVVSAFLGIYSTVILWKIVAHIQQNNIFPRVSLP